MRHHHVVSVKKRSLFMKALDAEGLQKILIEQAANGWIYQNMITGESQVLEKDVFLLVFYKEV